MLKIGITGQSGFIGTHINNTLNLFPDKFKLKPFQDKFFKDEEELERFVQSCDVVIHLAAMNRHNDPKVIYETNVDLVNRLIQACEKTNSKPHILFSSSTQEEQDNLYGRSKRDGRLLFEKWAIRNNAIFTGLIIPNVFGPFGNPYYNSVVATFSHQLTHNEMPKIYVDGEMKFIYVGELIKEIIEHIEVIHNKNQTGHHIETLVLAHTASIKVSELLKKLSGFKSNYFESGIIPDLSNPFDRNLFITFLCYTDHSTLYPFHLTKNIDSRGSFVEILKSYSKGQFSFSTTKPGITRGNHFHTRKTERFAVIKGKAKIELRRIGTDKIYTFKLDGANPSFVDMPVWYTHNITNIGDEDLYTFFWINEFYDPGDSDTFFEEV